MNKLALITAPAAEPVSVSEAKTHLRVDISADDTLIGNYITAARQYVEEHLRRALVTQTWELVLDYWPGRGKMRFPFPPLQSVTSVTYYDEDGNAAVYASSNYIVDTVAEPGAIVLKTSKTWPTVTLQEVNGIRVRYVAGYGAAAAVPQPIKSAILLLVGTLYENREDVQNAQGISVTTLPFGVQELLMPYRSWVDA
jgi:uncharacterized phiE125 gp8 family phage protein